METRNKAASGAPNPVKDKTFQFAIRMVRLYQYLVKEKKEFVLSKQLLRSGTNPGAMVREALNAESSLDFIHKLAIAQKETAESQYWLELLHKSNYLSDHEFQSLHQDTVEIMNLIRSIILTKKKNLALKSTLFLIFLSLTLFTL